MFFFYLESPSVFLIDAVRNMLQTPEEDIPTTYFQIRSIELDSPESPPVENESNNVVEHHDQRGYVEVRAIEPDSGVETESNDVDGESSGEQKKNQNEIFLRYSCFF